MIKKPYIRILFNLTFTYIIFFCVPLIVDANHITKKSDGTYVTNSGFICKDTDGTIGGMPCIINVYKNNNYGAMATNIKYQNGINIDNYYYSTLKYTPSIGGKGSHYFVFCVEHGKNNPVDGAACLLKYQNYDKYVLAGLGKIIQTTQANKLNYSNIQTYSYNYVNLALAQNNLLQKLKYYQDSDNYSVVGNDEIRSWTNKGIKSAFDYYYYSNENVNLLNIDLSYDKNKIYSKISGIKQTLKVDNETIKTDVISYDSCNYKISVDGEVKKSDSNCSNISVDLEKDLNNDGKTHTIQISGTISQTFYFAALYDCEGQDVTLQTPFPQKISRNFSKKIIVGDKGKIQIVKTDNKNNKLNGVAFSLVEKNSDGTMGSSLITKKTNAEGILTFDNLPGGKHYYLFEGFVAKGSCNNGNSSYYFNAEYSNYDLANTEYTYNDIKLNKKGTIKSYFSRTNNCSEIVRLPYVEVSAEANKTKTIHVKNMKVDNNDCQSELNNVINSSSSRKSLDLSSNYQKYATEDYRQILNLKSPRCSKSDSISPKYNSSCLEFDYNDDKEESILTDENGGKKFSKFNANDLSSFSQKIVLSEGTISSTARYGNVAYCKLTYNLVPVSAANSGNIVTNGQLYFNVKDGTVMRGEATRICYVPIDGNNADLGETILNNFKNKQNSILLPEVIMERKEDGKTINLTSHLGSSVYEHYNVTDDIFKNFFYHKIIETTPISYTIPKVYADKTGKWMDCLEEKSCSEKYTFLGYGILSPIYKSREKVQKIEYLPNTSQNKDNKDSEINEKSNEEKTSSSTTKEAGESLEKIDFLSIDSSSVNTDDVSSENSDNSLLQSETGYTVIYNNSAINTDNINGNGEAVNIFSSGDYFNDIYYFKINPKNKYEEKDGELTGTCNYKYRGNLCDGKLCLDFRIIDTNKPFINKDGSVRNTMTNWCNINTEQTNNLLSATERMGSEERKKYFEDIKNLINPPDNERGLIEISNELNAAEIALAEAEAEGSAEKIQSAKANVNKLKSEYDSSYDLNNDGKINFDDIKIIEEIETENYLNNLCSSNNETVNNKITNAANSYGMKNGTKTTPRYKIKITSEVINEIKKIKKNENLQYDTFNLECTTTKCRSKLLNQLKEKSLLSVNDL